ncbi:MAG: type VI secretion system tip protein VgrG [Bacteroidia bacterium]|jgi:Rhs element Vgr protein|nr:type VI secretion system tip protein VgrG [Bacteroidia bacterium]
MPTAPSPLTADATLATFTIKVNGTALQSSWQVVSVEVNKALNRISQARFVLRDGSASGEGFTISDAAVLVPGNPVIITAGYNSTEKQIFKGIIIQQGLNITQDDSQLEVLCKDVAVKMTVGRKNLYFNSGTSPVKDSDLMSKLIKASGASATVTATTVDQSQIYQHYSTDWDFVLSRAEANGMVVVVDDGKVSVKAPGVSGTAVLGVAYGSSLLEMEATLEATEQYSAVSASSWDVAQQKIITASGSNPSVNSQGNITSSTLSSVVGLSKFNLQSAALVPQAELKAWADAQQLKSWMSRLRGRIRFQGSSLAKPDTLIDVSGVGQRYNGSLYIRSVTHTIEDGDWITEAEFGLEPGWFSEQIPISAPPAMGMIPPVHGLQIGVVKQIHKDPDNNFRVNIKLPLMGDDGKAVWARMATFYATNGAGAYFYPEVNDEVVVGFFDDDPRAPVILGMLHSSKNKSPYTPEQKNAFKAIVSKSKLKIEIDDDKKILTITTPGNNKMIFSDDAKSITIADQNNNSIKMESGGITIDSAKDITISAKGNIKIDAMQQTAISAKTDMKVTGLNTKITAQAQLVASGTANSEFSSSGPCIVKGALVKIN